MPKATTYSSLSILSTTNVTFTVPRDWGSLGKSACAMKLLSYTAAQSRMELGLG